MPMPGVSIWPQLPYTFFFFLKKRGKEFGPIRGAALFFYWRPRHRLDCSRSAHWATLSSSWRTVQSSVFLAPIRAHSIQLHRLRPSPDARHEDQRPLRAARRALRRLCSRMVQGRYVCKSLFAASSSHAARKYAPRSACIHPSHRGTIG